MNTFTRGAQQYYQSDSLLNMSRLKIKPPKGLHAEVCGPLVIPDNILAL